MTGAWCWLDDALEALGRTDARKAKVIELRFFWRTDYCGDGRGSEDFRRQRPARLAVGEGLAGESDGGERSKSAAPAIRVKRPECRGNIPRNAGQGFSGR